MDHTTINGSTQMWTDAGAHEEYLELCQTTQAELSQPVIRYNVYPAQVKRIAQQIFEHHKVQDLIKDGWQITRQSIEAAFVHWIECHMDEIVESWTAEDHLHGRDGSLLMEIKEQADKHYPAVA